MTTTTHATAEVSQPWCQQGPQFEMMLKNNKASHSLSSAPPLPEPLRVENESHYNSTSLKLESNASHRVRVILSIAVTSTGGGSDEGCDLGVQEYNASTDQIRM